MSLSRKLLQVAYNYAISEVILYTMHVLVQCIYLWITFQCEVMFNYSKSKLRLILSCIDYRSSNVCNIYRICAIFKMVT